MAKNTGEGYRRGEVRDRSQFQAPDGNWVKRDDESGRILDQKQDGKPFKGVRADQLFLSVLVVGEIRQGIERLARRDRAQAEIFESWLSQLVDGYGDRLIPITAPIAETWGRLNVPDPVPVVDGLMAATALLHDWTLVTRNVDDVRPTGVRLLDPFTEASQGNTASSA